MKNTGTIIFTFDNILFDTDYNIYLELMKNDLYTQYIPIQTIKTLEEFNNRPQQDFLTEIISEKYKHDIKAKAEILVSYYIYEKKHNLYKEYKPSKLALGSLSNPYYIDNSEINEIYIIIPEERKEQIIECIKSFCINMRKIKFLYLNKDNSIHELISNISWNLLVTNNIKEVQYIAEKTNINKKEFLIPKVPYLNVERKVKILIEEKGGNINFYVPESD